MKSCNYPGAKPTKRREKAIKKYNKKAPKKPREVMGGMYSATTGDFA